MDTRANTARKIAAQLNDKDLTETQRRLVEDVVRAMVRDAEVRVRKVEGRDRTLADWCEKHPDRDVYEDWAGGNLETIGKIIVFVFLILAGGVAFLSDPDTTRHLSPLLPSGMSGLLAAMGFTFITLQGFDLIATVAGEVKRGGRGHADMNDAHRGPADVPPHPISDDLHRK